MRVAFGIAIVVLLALALTCMLLRVGRGLPPYHWEDDDDAQ